MRNLILILCLIWSQTVTGQKQAIVHLTTDNYPTETYWQVLTGVSGTPGDTISSVLPGHYTSANTTYTDTLYIADSITNISFLLRDTYGDGMLSGSYYFSVCGDTIVNYPTPNPNIGYGLYHNRVVPPCMPNPPPNCVPAQVIINLDQYQSETSWDIKDSLGTVIASGGSYGAHPDYSTVIEPVCIPKGNLTFTIYDSYGDGLNGSLWQGQDGSYFLTQCNDTLVYGTNPAFGNDTTHTFVSDSCPPIFGCTDQAYLEYNPLADVDDSSCVTLAMYGCTDSTMYNYDSTANAMEMVDSCSYTLVLQDLMGNGWIGSNLEIILPDTSYTFTHTGSFSQTYNLYLPAQTLVVGKFTISQQAALTTIECGFQLINPLGDTIIGVQAPFIQPIFPYSGITTCGNTCIDRVYGCTDLTAVNYSNIANTDDSTCYYNPGCINGAYLEYYTQGYSADYDDGSCNTLAVWGCTDSTMFNYDSLANMDNGGCIPVIEGCMNSLAFNYNALANTPDTCIPVVYGCTSPIAFNYDSLANTDDGSCVGIVYGCTDSTMWNFMPSANIDNGGCIPYMYGCTDPTMFNYDVNANTDNGSCTPYIFGCMDPTAFNYDPLANTDDSSCVAVVNGCTNPIALNYNPLANVDDFSCILPIYGCTDSTAFNYDPLANTNNGSCIPVLLGCTDPSALNYNPLANTDDFSCILPIYGCTDSTMFNYSPLANTDNGTCIPFVYGCTDGSAYNYDPLANTEDGSCYYLPGCTNPAFLQFWIQGYTADYDNGSCIDSVVYGCMDATMYNYNPLANMEDGSCTPIVYGCLDSTMFNFNPLANTDNNSCIPFVYGCNDATAYNYNPLANTSDNSCCYIAGCMDPTALNYEPMACYDDGSCITIVVGCTDVSAYNYNPAANVSDSTACLYDAGCIGGPGVPYWLNDPCYAWVIDVDSYCCDVDWDSDCQSMYNYCEAGWTGPTNIEDIRNKLIVYPNPTEGTVWFSRTVDVVIYDFTGKIVYEGKSVKSVDLTGNSNGIYNVYLKKYNKNFKITKQ